MRLAASALLLCGLTGCSDGGAPTTDPTTTAGSPSKTVSSPTEEPTATIEPATGDLVRFEQFSFNAPPGWKVGELELFSRSVDSPPPRQQIRKGEPFGYVVASAGPAVRKSLGQLAREDVADGEATRVENVELDGETVYHVSKPDQAFETNEVFGLWRNGERISIRFSMIEATPRKRQAIVDSVLATWEWTS